MKKKFKVFIAFVLILAVAVGAYFLFFNKTKAQIVYSNTYKLINRVDDYDTNKMQTVNDTIDEIIALINNNPSMDMGEQLKTFNNYVILQNAYDIVVDEILTYGIEFKGNKTINKNIKAVASGYKNLKKLYDNLYDNLQNGYLRISNPQENLGTAKQRINEFYLQFADLNSAYNDYFYNAGVVYARAVVPTMQKHNLYKLKVEFYCNTVNSYFNDEASRASSYLTQIANFKGQLTKDLTTLYYNNKTQIDLAFTTSATYNIGEIVASKYFGSYNDLFANLDEASKIILQNYIDYVAGGGVI